MFASFGSSSPPSPARPAPYMSAQSSSPTPARSQPPSPATWLDHLPGTPPSAIRAAASSPAQCSSTAPIQNLSLDGGSVHYKLYLTLGQTATIIIIDERTGGKATVTYQEDRSRTDVPSKDLRTSGARPFSLEFQKIPGAVHYEVNLKEGQTVTVTICDANTWRQDIGIVQT